LSTSEGLLLRWLGCQKPLSRVVLANGLSSDRLTSLAGSRRFEVQQGFTEAPALMQRRRSKERLLLFYASSSSLLLLTSSSKQGHPAKNLI